MLPQWAHSIRIIQNQTESQLLSERDKYQRQMRE